MKFGTHYLRLSLDTDALQSNCRREKKVSVKMTCKHTRNSHKVLTVVAVLLQLVHDSKSGVWNVEIESKTEEGVVLFH